MLCTCCVELSLRPVSDMNMCELLSVAQTWNRTLVALDPGFILVVRLCMPSSLSLLHCSMFILQWGGGIMGVKSQHKQKQKERVLAKELAQRAGV